MIKENKLLTPSLIKLCWKELSSVAELIGYNAFACIDSSQATHEIVNDESRKYGELKSMLKNVELLSLNFDDEALCVGEGKSLLIVGMPAEDKKHKKAIECLNKALSVGKIVAFIVSTDFRKWSVQKHISEDAFLVKDVSLEKVIHDKSGEELCFQVWLSPHDTAIDFKNIRLQEKPNK